MLYLCCLQNSQVMVEACAPILMRAVTQMSAAKMSASFNLPISCISAFRLGDGGLGTMLVGWGLVLALAQVPCLAWVLGEFLLCLSPLGVQRSCVLDARALMLHKPQALAIITLDLVSVIPLA